VKISRVGRRNFCLCIFLCFRCVRDLKFCFSFSRTGLRWLHCLIPVVLVYITSFRSLLCCSKGVIMEEVRNFKRSVDLRLLRLVLETLKV
jgi:hypothetical protein